MRIRFLLAFAALAAACALPAPLPAQTSYPIVCRGGPAMRLEVEVKPGTASRVLLRFTRASRAAITGVDAGTCAWQDRGMRTSEPAVLCFAGADYVGFQVTGTRELPYLRLRTLAGATPIIFWEGGERPDGVAVRIGAGEAQYYRARYHAAGGCLLVTRAGP